MKNLTPARATVIIPTFGYAPFAKWAIQSVQRQTVRELEICIICDGSSDEMADIFHQMSQEDCRIQVFRYPKSPRTGEPYRDEVIRKTTGAIICYCSHDDLWLPNHVETLEKTLINNDFTHSMHASVNIPAERSQGLFRIVYSENLEDPQTIARFINNDNFFGLTFGAHTRKAYFELNEGWVTTPDQHLATDLYMWKKLADKFPGRMATTFQITALCFPKVFRESWSEDQRSDEVYEFFSKTLASELMTEINAGLLYYFYQQLRFAQNTQVLLSQDINHIAAERDSFRIRVDELESALRTEKIAVELLASKQVSLKYLLRRFSKEIVHRITTGHR